MSLQAFALMRWSHLPEVAVGEAGAGGLGGGLGGYGHAAQPAQKALAFVVNALAGPQDTHPDEPDEFVGAQPGPK